MEESCMTQTVNKINGTISGADLFQYLGRHYELHPARDLPPSAERRRTPRFSPDPFRIPVTVYAPDTAPMPSLMANLSLLGAELEGGVRSRIGDKVTLSFSLNGAAGPVFLEADVKHHRGGMVGIQFSL